MTSGESLVPCALLLEQESYLSYIKKVIKYIANYWPISLLNLDYKIYTEILKNPMQITLDTIIRENQLAAIKNRTILHTLSIIRYIIDVSNKLSKNLSV